MDDETASQPAPEKPAEAEPGEGEAQRKRRPGGAFSISLRELMIVAAILALILAAMMPWYQASIVRRDVARVKAGMRSLHTAIEAYCIDWMSYPPCGLAEGPPRVRRDGTVVPSGIITVHSHLPVGSGARRMITFGLVSPTPHTLTTPVAYARSLPSDLFADTPGATFGYYNARSGWIMWSPGPDRDENDPGGPGDIGACVEAIYTGAVSQPSPTLLKFIYDPTNGIWSEGDIIRVRQ